VVVLKTTMWLVWLLVEFIKKKNTRKALISSWKN
jgi:hypothetical protein